MKPVGATNESFRGMQFIKYFEGTKRNAAGLHIPYNDVAGHATQGYGHLLHKGPVTEEDRAKEPWTEEDATEMLRHDLAWAVESVRIAVKAPLFPHQFDAITSWFFNLGRSQATMTSNLVQLVNSPIYWEAALEGRAWPSAAVAEEFGVWHFAGGKPSNGLMRRRAAEAKLWNTGNYV